MSLQICCGIVDRTRRTCTGSLFSFLFACVRGRVFVLCLFVCLFVWLFVCSKMKTQNQTANATNTPSNTSSVLFSLVFLGPHGQRAFFVSLGRKSRLPKAREHGEALRAPGHEDAPSLTVKGLTQDLGSSKVDRSLFGEPTRVCFLLSLFFLLGGWFWPLQKWSDSPTNWLFLDLRPPSPPPPGLHLGLDHFSGKHMLPLNQPQTGYPQKHTDRPGLTCKPNSNQHKSLNFYWDLNQQGTAGPLWAIVGWWFYRGCSRGNINLYHHLGRTNSQRVLGASHI